MNKLISKGMVVYRYDPAKANWPLVVSSSESFGCDKAGYLVWSPKMQSVDLTGDACGTYTWQELKDSLVKDSWNLVGIYSDIEVEDADNLILKYDEAEDEWYPVVEGETLRRGHAYWVLEGTPGASRFTISDRFSAWDWLQLGEILSFTSTLVKRIRRLLSEGLSISTARQAFITLLKVLNLPITIIRSCIFFRQRSEAFSAIESSFREVLKRLFITSTYKHQGTDEKLEVEDNTYRLMKGDNFISLVSEAGDLPPEEIFSNDIEIWAWDADQQLWYRPSKLECGRGYLVRVPEDREITLPNESSLPDGKPCAT